MFLVLIIYFSTHIIGKVSSDKIRIRLYFIQFFLLLCFWFFGNLLLHDKLNILPTRYYIDVLFIITALGLRYLNKRNRHMPIDQSEK